MRHDIHMQPPDQPGDGHARYQWRTGRQWNTLAVNVSGYAQLPADDSVETFITEHYWGYARQPDGTTVEYEVKHPQWRVWQATSSQFSCNVTQFYGQQFAPFLTITPDSAFIANGSNVTV